MAMEGNQNKVQWLLENKAFRDWVYRPTGPLHQQWQQWEAHQPDWQEAIQQARVLLLDSRGELPDLSDEHIERQVRQVVARLRTEGNEGPRSLFRPPASRNRWLAAAALIALLVGIGWWGRLRTPDSPRVSVLPRPAAAPSVRPALNVVVNQSGHVQTLTLPDGSTVRVHPGGRLRYPKSFGGGRREVYLTGEAFFSIRHDPAHPFWVHAPGVHTRVLGTSFTVRAYEGATQATVTVRTGRVSVYAAMKDVAQPSAKRGVVLTPNQRAVWIATDQRLTRTLVEQPQPVVATERTPTFTFHRTPLPVVLKKLSDTYGIVIRYDEPTLRSCTLTATLGTESLWEKLRWVCMSTGSTYEVIDGQIVLSSPGCGH